RYLAIGHSLVTFMQLMFASPSCKEENPSTVKHRQIFFEKAALPGLIVQYVMVALFYYNGFIGVFEAQLFMALLNTPILVFNTHGYFTRSPYWQSIFTKVDDKTTFPEPLAWFYFSYFFFAAMVGIFTYQD
ncbi:hypothetical protein PFISCL1PPCAC_22474, partial [Pristionchus fissidentatus]